MSKPPTTGAAIAAAYEAARDAVIDAKLELERAERRLAKATDRLLAYAEAQRRHPSTQTIAKRNA